MVCHRDLKPSNILVEESNKIDPFVKIIDFNVSKFGEGKRTNFKDRIQMWT